MIISVSSVRFVNVAVAMLYCRWKWWKEQNRYLQLAQSVAMGNADMQLQHDRSLCKKKGHTQIQLDIMLTLLGLMC